MTYGLYSLGQPLMDILVEVEEEELKRYPVKKGSGVYFSESELETIDSMLADKEKTMISGGSSANATVVFSQLGGKSIFYGKVGHDEMALAYKDGMRAAGVDTVLSFGDSPTGRTLTFVTPDSERSFAIYLGAAKELVNGGFYTDPLKESNYFHVEGFLFQDPRLREFCEQAISIANDYDVKVSIDCADPGIIQCCRSDMERIIGQYSDVVFANEKEAIALTGASNSTEALHMLGELCDIAVVKLGDKGSLVKQGGKVFEIEPVSVNAVDTTGAGDSYAGAFLYALSKGYDVKKAGDLGSYISAKVVERMGARLVSVPDYSHII